MSDAPPYRITPEILSLVEQVGEGLGRAEALGIARDLRLRRINRIRSIRGSLAIEGNTLSEQQVATLLDGNLQMIRAALAPTVLGDQAADQVTDQVGRLLNLLLDGPHTAAQLLARLGLSHRPTLRANYLRPALALGLVEMTRSCPLDCAAGRPYISALSTLTLPFCIHVVCAELG